MSDQKCPTCGGKGLVRVYVDPDDPKESLSARMMAVLGVWKLTACNDPCCVARRKTERKRGMKINDKVEMTEDYYSLESNGRRRYSLRKGDVVTVVKIIPERVIPPEAVVSLIGSVRPDQLVKLSDLVECQKESNDEVESIDMGKT